MEQLKGIFPDRSIEELQVILCRHDNDVSNAVDTILKGETAAVRPTSNHTDSRLDRGDDDADVRFARNEPMTAQSNNTKVPPRPSRAATTTASWWGSPTICAPPPRRPLSETAQERRRIMMEAQQLAKLKEQADLEAALKASMAPSDKGRLAGHVQHLGQINIANETLDELMHNPAFFAQLDDDLKVAIELQRKLDEEELDKIRPSKTDPVAVNSSIFPNLGASVRNRLLSVGASFLRRSSSCSREEEELVEKLEAMNRANEEERKRREELDRVRREAELACMQAVKDHLKSFLEENPEGTYEEWIEELHPENAHDGRLLEGLSKTIDHRFYVEESDHRKLWNDNLNNSGMSSPAGRQFVHVRYSPAKVKNEGSNTGVVDLLTDDVNQEANVGVHSCRTRQEGSISGRDKPSSPTPAGGGDLISFQ